MRILIEDCRFFIVDFHFSKSSANTWFVLTVIGIPVGIFSTRCVRSGIPASGRSGFARFSVSGQRRVAKPPARMKAFIGKQFTVFSGAPLSPFPQWDRFVRRSSE